eukprot:scaffold763_cov98-Cylindrotheca_fusiformis.AAC.7
MMLDTVLLKSFVLLLGLSSSFSSAQERMIDSSNPTDFQPSSTSYLNNSAPTSSPDTSWSHNSTIAPSQPSPTSSPSESSPSSSPSVSCGSSLNSYDYLIACPTTPNLRDQENSPGLVIYFSWFLVFLICAFPKVMGFQRRSNTESDSNGSAQNASPPAEDKEAREKQIIANFEIKTIETVDIQPLLEQKEYNSAAFRVERVDSNDKQEKGESSTIVDKLPNEERRDDFDVEKGTSKPHQKETHAASFQVEKGESNKTPETDSSTSVDDKSPNAESHHDIDAENDTTLQQPKESNSASLQIQRGDSDTKDEPDSITSMDKSQNVKNGDGVDIEKGNSEIGNKHEELGTGDDTSTASDESTTLMDQFLSYWRGQKVERAECSICLERYKAGDTICVSKHPNCNHIFHKDCAAQWLVRRNNCPLCRIDLINEK